MNISNSRSNSNNNNKEKLVREGDKKNRYKRQSRADKQWYNLGGRRFKAFREN